MGYSVRTAQWRYTEWRNWKTGAVESRELYDHTSDQPELENVITNPPDQAALNEAQKHLQAQFPPAKAAR
jgi:iduronate 2-sulfatase